MATEAQRVSLHLEDNRILTRCRSLPSLVVRFAFHRKHWADVAGKYTVTLIPGDGIGAEVADSVKEIFTHINVPVQWEQYNVSGETKGGEELFQQAMDSLKRNKVGLKGMSAAMINI